MKSRLIDDPKGYPKCADCGWPLPRPLGAVGRGLGGIDEDLRAHRQRVARVQVRCENPKCQQTWLVPGDAWPTPIMVLE